MNEPAESAHPIDGVLLAAAALGALVLLAPRLDPLTTDSLSYLDVAANLKSGRGLVHSVVDFWRPALPDPLGLWPPLYPALVALAGLALPLEVAARAVTGASFVAFAFAFHALADRAVGRALGALATVLAVFAPGVLALGLHAWSEATFLALLAGALALLAGRDRTSVTPRRAALAGLLLGLAALTRHAGLPLVLVAGLAALLAPGVRPASRAAFAALALAPPLAWMARNLVVFGRPLGPALPPARQSVLEQGSELARALRWELVPAPFDVSPFLGTALVTAFVLGVILALVRGGAGRISGLVGIVLLVTVLAATSTTAINAPTGRYLAPALPFLALAAVAGLVGADAQAMRRRLVGGLVAVLALATAIEAIELPRHDDPTAARADRAALVHLVDPEGRGPVLSDAGHLVRVATGRAAVQIPPPEFRPRDYDASDDARWQEAGVNEAVFASGAPPAGAWRKESSAGRFTAYRRIASASIAP